MPVADAAVELSIIVPALNEADIIEDTLQRLQPLRGRGHEVIVVDGSSRDGTVGCARPLVDRLIRHTPGRARQMMAGARVARGEVLWFLHADTRAVDEADSAILQALSARNRHWGRFDVRLSGPAAGFRVIERMMNWRSRLTGIATGDQGIFVRRVAFERVGGFADLPLMEDIDLCRRLRRAVGRPVCPTTRLITSSRRWESRGTARTVLLMWRLRLAYALGAEPSQLARRYR